jgi:hypothetical protein
VGRWVRRWEGRWEKERCEGERETAQVSSFVGMVVNAQRSQIRTPGLGRRHLSGPSLKVDNFW